MCNPINSFREALMVADHTAVVLGIKDGTDPTSLTLT